jgi:hypothetical protein
MSTQGISVNFTCANPFALLTTDCDRKGSHTRSAYIVAEPDSVVLIDDLQFHLYLAVPKEVDVHVLYEEMMLCYGLDHYGRRAQEALWKKIQELRLDIDAIKSKTVSGGSDEDTARRLHYRQLERSMYEAKLVTMRNQAHLQSRFKALVRGGGEQEDISDDDEGAAMPIDLQTKPSAARIEWLKNEINAPGFFFIKAHSTYNLAPTAVLARKKLAQHDMWRFTFDNHATVQYFIKKMTHEFEIGASFDTERQTKIPGTRHQIHVMKDGSKTDPTLYAAPNGDGRHQQYVLSQCQLFTQADYVYKWSWTAPVIQKNGCLEPPFAAGDSTIVEHDIIERLKRHTSTVTTGGAKPTHRPVHCTLIFSLTDLPQNVPVYRVSIRDKACTLSLGFEVKKRSVAAAELPDHDTGLVEKKRPATPTTRSVATPRLSHLPGQQKKLQQGTLSFIG